MKTMATKRRLETGSASLMMSVVDAVPQGRGEMQQAVRKGRRSMVRMVRLQLGKARLASSGPTTDDTLVSLYYKGDQWILCDPSRIIASHEQTISECDWQSQPEAEKLADAVGDAMVDGLGYSVLKLSSISVQEARRMVAEWGWFRN